MNLKALLFALCSLLFATSAQAQWKSESYPLLTGWNSIYLHGDATHTTPDLLFGANTKIEEVWRWNPNPTAVGFTTTPLIPAPGTEEWSVWVKNGTANTLTDLTGQNAYLVRCSAGTTLNILQRPLPPSSTWVRSGANLLGFPTRQNGNFPLFSAYFATFPAAIAANSKIFKYVGGPFSSTNPQLIFSPSLERVDRNKAYWFSSEVVGNFYAPLEIDLTNRDGLAFGLTGTVITARIRNRTGAQVTLTLAPVASANSPSGATLTEVPLTRRTYNVGTGVWEDIPAAGDVVIGAQSTVQVHFGLNRAGMSGLAGTLYASLLRLTDAGNLMDVYLPVSAEVASLSGLWAGDIEVTNVDSRVATSGRALATATVNGSGVVTGIAVDDGGLGYDLTPVVTVADTQDLSVGMVVIGPGITGSASISSILGSTRLRLSQSPPDGTVVLSFGQALLSTTSTGGASVTVASTAGLSSGMAVVGTGITGTASIVSITDATTLVLSQSPPAGTSEFLYGAVVLTAQVRTPQPPTVVIAAPSGTGGVQATATATVSNGIVTGFAITQGGSGYAVPPAKSPQVTVTAPVPGTVPRPYTLRTLLHVADGEVAEARLLSQVFLGRLNQVGNVSGICTKEAGLNPNEKANALRFSVAHLPLDLVLGSSAPGSNGTVAPGSTLVRTVVVPFNDRTNPFVHQYHPDHDNRDARPDGTNTPKGNGDESYTLTRTCSFTFTATPPEGVSSTGWGSSAIGGTYTEIFRGLHRDALVVSGTFVLRRVSETGAITLNN
jgi:hypothetical protein